MSSYYLLFLIFSLSGLTILDYRFKLVWFDDWRRAIVALLPVYLLLVAWDLFGIAFKIFYMGQSKYMLGFEVLPNVPPEEFFFLGLLVYLPLLLWRFMTKVKHV